MKRNIYVILVGIIVLAELCGQCKADNRIEANNSKAISIEEVVRLLPGDLRTPNRYALVVGTGQYDDSRIPKLPASSNDARQLHNVLTDPAVGMFLSGNVTLLLDENVTRNKVVEALDMLGRKANKEDLVVVFFSGHGALDEKGRSYWVMQDSKIDRLRATALAETEITELLGEIKTTRLVTLIDACYSASTVELGKSKSLVDLKKIYPKFTGDGRVAITASKGDQLSVVISDKNHPGKGYSAFAWHLIRAMKGLGDLDKDGVVTVNELWSYVKDRTEITARQQGGNQQPQLKGQIGSKFLLTVDSQRLVTNSQRTRQFLETLKKLFMNDSIDSDIYKEGKKLLTSREENLDWVQQERKQIYIDLVSGELKPKYLQSALDAIETPEQRAVRLEREAKERAEQAKQARIKELLSTARSNDNKTDGKKALEALKEILQLDPSHSQALRLQKKISGYFGPPPGDVITNSIGMKLVYIPAGEFMMGSNDGGPDEKPVHKVKISEGFYMGQTEVTQAQYRAVMGINPSHFEGDNNPVEQVSWDMAMEFCKKLSQKENGRTYTLPTEAQWEYACRAGSTTVFSFGNSQSSLGDYAWYRSNSGKITHVVGQKRPNNFGSYDMHGNVWEWCRDCYGSGYYSRSITIDPENTQRAVYRVLRGGSWSSGTDNCRSAARSLSSSNDRSDYDGFRVVMNVDEDAIGYVASRNSIVYHLPTCEIAQKIKDRDILTFSNKEEAEKIGRFPCKRCNP